jgi:hypothetical protein
MNGFFLGLGLNLRSEKVGSLELSTTPPTSIKVTEENELLFSPCLMFGLNLPLKPNLCMELTGGIGFFTRTGEDEDDEKQIFLGVPLGLRVGYMFGEE